MGGRRPGIRASFHTRSGCCCALVRPRSFALCTGVGARSGYRDQTLMAILANEVTLRINANFTVAMLLEVLNAFAKLDVHVRGERAGALPLTIQVGGAAGAQFWRYQLGMYRFSSASLFEGL